MVSLTLLPSVYYLFGIIYFALCIAEKAEDAKNNK